MKRFTLILSLLVVMVTTAMAGKLVGSTTDNPVYFKLKNANGNYIKANAVDGNEETAGKFAFYAVNGVENAYYIYSVDEAKWFNYTLASGYSNMKGFISLSEEKVNYFNFTECNKDGKNGYQIAPYNTNGVAAKYLNYFQGVDNKSTIGLYEGNGSSDAGSCWLLEECSVDPLSTPKSKAKETVEALAKINVIFPDATDVLAAIDASESEDAINTIVANYTQNAADKNIKLCNKGGNGRAGNYLGYDKTNSRAAAVANSDEVIWTIKMNADGTFKLYNYLNNLYLGAPADPTPTTANEADAPSFTIIPTAENVAAVVCTNGNMVHAANHSNFKIISYNSLTDAASLWDVTVVPEIVVERDVYYNGVAVATTLPYAIQQAYGLVTDASNYFSNYKSTAEGSYEALLDNVETTYFHSAYGEEPGDGTGVHYIQANLGDGNSVDEFYFYMVPRSGNGNNRPVDIIVAGSNDNATYEKIAEVKTTLDGSMTPYLSAKLGTDGTNYQYIRLTVTGTNTGTKFFTLSELYFFTATSDVTSLVDSYNAFKASSITDMAMNDAVTALVNAENVLALSNIKKEIATLISANESNHATTPALGQYATAGYDALVAAYDADDATQESLEAAITAFNKTKNVPVYFIRSAHDGYAAGSAIYYDGAWKWKTANKYDKQMWMTIPAYAQANVPAVDAYDSEGTSYEICDYLTGTVMRSKSVQIVAIEGLENAYNLQYNADANSTDAAQHAKDTKALVNWKPATATDSRASAWYVDYLGTSFELDQLTDEKIAALAALQTAYNAKAFYADAVMGDGLGEYTGDRDAIVAVLPEAETIGAKTLAEQAVLSIDDINAATDALNSVAALVINMPASGKYYRIQGACEASPANHYITGHTNADGGRIALTEKADASTIYYFDGTNLIAYQSGLVVGLNSNHWTFASFDDNSKPASEIEFAQSPRTAGAYTVKSANVYMHYKTYEGAAEIDRCSSDAGHANHDWYLTEVTSLPVTVTAAGYATFYAPVAVTIPEGVTAHTVTINGEWATLSEALTVIPAETGVVLAGAENDYDFTITTADAFEGENLMVGTIAKTLVTKPENTECYVLANGKNGVGMYAAVNKEDKTKFYNAGHKAYLAVKGADGVKSYSFRFGEGTTGIDEVKTENGEVKAIYDLTGRRVEAITAPGIYIVNGKKVLVK